jgi:aspartyl-tRNA(Asn)/glutamyl-tRNA(Gln) amidotransferase subunit B
LTRIHLEEDVAKSFHFEDRSGIDFNRAGTPLMEIVSEADLRTPGEAFAFLGSLRQVLLSGNVSDADMEKGQMRCDVNVSVRPVGQKEFGTKVELKNLNSISGVRRALTYEIARQIAACGKGEAIAHETRRWDDEAGATFTMRTKEKAHDYRYFPEPDLPVLVLDPAQVERLRGTQPELPAAMRKRLVSDYGLSPYDAGVLTAEPVLARYFEAAVAAHRNPKAICNWVTSELLGRVSATAVDACSVTPHGLARLVALIDDATISGNDSNLVATVVAH